MNYRMLDKVISKRCLPDDSSAPRAKLFELWRTLEELREELRQLPMPQPQPQRNAATWSAAAGSVSEAAQNPSSRLRTELQAKIEFYERLLEG